MGVSRTAAAAGAFGVFGGDRCRENPRVEPSTVSTVWPPIEKMAATAGNTQSPLPANAAAITASRIPIALSTATGDILLMCLL